MDGKKWHTNEIATTLSCYTHFCGLFRKISLIKRPYSLPYSRIISIQTEQEFLLYVQLNIGVTGENSTKKPAALYSNQFLMKYS